MADQATMTVPVTSKAELDLGELETKYAKLQEELAERAARETTLRSEMGRLKEKVRKKQVPVSLTTVDESGTASAPPASSPTHARAVVGTPAAGGHNPQAFIMNHVHINGNGQASTDLGHDPNGDVGVEGLIQQATVGMRALADMARESARHKSAAFEAWAQVRALQNFTGYQAPPLQYQQQQPMGMHISHVGGGYMAQGP